MSRRQFGVRVSPVRTLHHMTSYSMSERVGWRAGDLLWLITAVHVCLTPTTSQNKKRPLECLMTEKGAEYTGSRAYTATFRACQPWSQQSPHAHDFARTSMFPGGGVDEAYNYCRNPGGIRSRPWCFTLDPDVPWEYCQINPCGCRMTKLGLHYTGTVSRTVSGLDCQRWELQEPHKHPYKEDSAFPDGSVQGVQNFCRNPLQDGDGPWCYTSDPGVRWAYCDIPFCECKTTETGEEYGGQISHTATGKTCRRWDSRHPHCHYLVSRGRSVHSASVRGGSASSSSSSGTSSTCGHFPAARIEDSANFCRNPDPLHHPLGPWCLTSDPVHGWDYCDIPLCAPPPNTSFLVKVVPQGPVQVSPSVDPASSARSSSMLHEPAVVAGLISTCSVVLLALLVAVSLLVFARRLRQLGGRNGGLRSVYLTSESIKLKEGQDGSSPTPTYSTEHASLSRPHSNDYTEINEELRNNENNDNRYEMLKITSTSDTICYNLPDV